MKLVFCVVHGRDKGKVSDELVKANFKATVIASTGGFLREGNTTFLIGVEDSEVGTLQKLISESCSIREQIVNVMPFDAGPPGAFIPNPVRVPVGGAVVFVLNVEQFNRF